MKKLPWYLLPNHKIIKKDGKTVATFYIKVHTVYFLWLKIKGFIKKKL